jgi:hypothetical protein
MRFDAFLLAASMALLGGVDRWMSRADAQSSNASFTLTHETMVSGGGSVGSGNPMSAVTVIGSPAGGTIANGSFTVTINAPTSPPARPPGTRIISVEGSVTEPNTSVTVNGIVASVTGTTFRADGITLIEGPNTLTTSATDLAGNNASRAITVTLDTHPPARPTVAGTPAVTTATSYALTGTKTAGTSIWINGTQAVPLGDATSWTATISLVEGDNVLVIVTKDAAGNTSATNTVNIVVDNLPPVITVSAPAKTNLNPFSLSGTVDDSLTTVQVNGVLATRSARTFTASVPLTEGPNTLTVTATSPNGFVSTRTLTITLGTVPTITSLQPTDASKLYAGTAATIQATATDKEADPIQYQFVLDGSLLADWSSVASQSWTPAEAQRGLHTVTVNVRDGFGGSNASTIEVYVVRQPVSPP